jgi:hypothetical protein
MVSGSKGESSVRFNAVDEASREIGLSGWILLAATMFC